MQNAKDTFYMALQSRLTALNPDRTLVLRGAVRPGILVEENELPTASIQVDAFRLEWSGLQIDSHCALPRVQLECSIHYATDGNPGNGGMDRGRLLAAMDAELLRALTTGSQATGKMNYSAAGIGIAPLAMATSVLWTNPSFGPATLAGERLERTATVQVLAYQEAGER